MTISSTIALAVAMFILAITPGPGILLITSQTASHGLRAGFFTMVGIIVADISFILLVGYGLSNVTHHISNATIIISLLGGIYLIYLGIQTIRSHFYKSNQSQFSPIHRQQVIKFFSTGFFITLSNPKAILFYLSFLPAFIDLQAITHQDIIIIAITAAIVIGMTMMFYALLTHKTSQLALSSTKQYFITQISGGLIICVGVYMILRSVSFFS